MPADNRASPGADDAQVVAELAIGAVADVEELRGVRVNVDDGGSPLVEYLVHWKGGAPDTWEPAENIAENLLRDYEDRWWQAAREGDEEVLKSMLTGGRRVLTQAVDENRRSALHFAAATGNVRVVRILCEAGAEVDLRDKDGYTPLHMAAGYLHVQAVQGLLFYGADPEIRDREERSVLDLVERLKGSLPPTDPQIAQRRFALEKTSEILTATLYDELEPLQILDARKNDDGGRDFLVQWPDDSPDSWVSEQYVAEDIKADFDAGLEFAEAAEILRMVQRGDQRTFLVRWTDSEQYPDSWEDEEHLSEAMVAAWMKTQDPRVLARAGGGGRRKHRKQKAVEGALSAV